MRAWDDLPPEFKTDAVEPYYRQLKKKALTRAVKRFADLVLALVLFIVLFPVNLVVGIIVKTTSKGPVFYRQTRIGRYNREFRIFKFRTMVENAEQLGTQITVGERDPRITGVGHFLRRTRLDEFPQLLNVILGDMSLVGTRPEVRRYVDEYSPEMYATLLLAPGISSITSLRYRNESVLLEGQEDPEAYYINQILPDKMKVNLEYLENLSVLLDIKILVQTALAIFK